MDWGYGLFCGKVFGCWDGGPENPGQDMECGYCPGAATININALQAPTALNVLVNFIVIECLP
jgi:hypothetical protein